MDCATISLKIAVVFHTAGNVPMAMLRFIAIPAIIRTISAMEHAYLELLCCAKMDRLGQCITNVWINVRLFLIKSILSTLE